MSDCDCGHCVGIDNAFEFLEKKLCPAGKAAAKRKFKVYPSAYANGWAVQYCRGKFRGKKKGKKKGDIELTIDLRGIDEWRVRAVGVLLLVLAS